MFFCCFPKVQAASVHIAMDCTSGCSQTERYMLDLHALQNTRATYILHITTDPKLPLLLI